MDSFLPLYGFALNLFSWKSNKTNPNPRILDIFVWFGFVLWNQSIVTVNKTEGKRVWYRWDLCTFKEPFQRATLLESGTKGRSLPSTASIHISRSNSAAVGSSLTQNDPDCPAREKRAYYDAHTLDEKGRIRPNEWWGTGRAKLAGRMSCVWGLCWPLICARHCRSSVHALDRSIVCSAQCLIIALIC